MLLDVNANSLPGVEDVGGDAPEHEIGRQKSPFRQAFDGLRKIFGKNVVGCVANTIGTIEFKQPRRHS